MIPQIIQPVEEGCADTFLRDLIYNNKMGKIKQAQKRCTWIF